MTQCRLISGVLSRIQGANYLDLKPRFISSRGKSGFLYGILKVLLKPIDHLIIVDDAQVDWALGQ